MATFDDLKTKLETALTNLVTLDIITVVGSSNYTSGKQGRSFEANAKMMRTRIDLVQGDITTEMDEAFVTGDYQGLREFHAARERQGSEIIKGNLAAIERLFETISKLANQPNAPPGAAPPAGRALPTSPGAPPRAGQT